MEDVIASGGSNNFYEDDGGINVRGLVIVKMNEFFCDQLIK